MRAFAPAALSAVVMLLLACGGDRVVDNRPPPPIPDPACGDGNVDEGEDCDGSNLGEQSCSSLGFDLGTLSCDAQCRFATLGCVKFCGNGTVEPGEQCDPGMGPGACDGWGYTGCTDTCQRDALTCRSQSFKVGASLSLPSGGLSALGDLSPRGPGDLVTAVPGFTRLQTHEWKPAQGFVPGRTVSRTDGKVPYEPIAADLDGDGQVDMAAVNTDGTVDRYLYVPAGGGEPARFVVEPLVATQGGGGGDPPCFVGPWLGAGNVFGGGGEDLLALACAGATGSITWDGVYVFPGGAEVSAPTLVSEQGIRHGAVGDVDGDGVLDLVLSLMGGDVVLRRGPDFTEAAMAWLGQANAQALLLADLDGDGDGDLVVFASGEAVLYEHTPQGLVERRRLDAVSPAFPLARDLDLDGHVDVAWLSGDALEVRRNVGDFTFTPFTVTVGENLGAPLSLSVGDLESDGDPDLAATYRSSGGADATVTYPLINPVRG